MNPCALRRAGLPCDHILLVGWLGVLERAGQA